MFGFINGESYPLVSCDCLLLKMAIEIVDLPSNSMVILDSYVSLPEGRYTMICRFAFVGPIEPQMN